MLGIKTIGNATLIAYDGRPVLATDPWFGDEDDAFFGSWGLTHEIPPAERAEILAAPFVWFSHGHPDHLNPKSIEQLKHATILVPDHVGGRIRHDLDAGGYKVRTLPDAAWVELSPHIRVLCLCDYLQDAVLLVDVAGRLFIDMNDCEAKGRLRLIARIAQGFPDSYLLRLSGYGDAGMINLHDPDGRRIEPQLNREIGRWLSAFAKRLGAKNVVPFSSFHKYQRTDSAWANEYVAPLSAYRAGFDESAARFIPPFSWIDCISGKTQELRPRALDLPLRSPERFGDRWSDELDADDKRVLDDYFRPKAALNELLGFLTFVVGGKPHRIDFTGPRDRGITFEAPRNSLMAAVTHRVFDDLSGSNFMKTTLHNLDTFYATRFSLHAQNFDFIVGKFADNGRAESRRELDDYFAEYRKRAGADWIVHRLMSGGQTVFRRYVRKESPLYRVARDVYTSVLRS
jgi:hypothetical protein